MPSPFQFLSHFLFIISYEVCIIVLVLLIEKVILSRVGNGQTEQRENPCYVTSSPGRSGCIIIIKSVIEKLLCVGRCSALSYLLLTTAQ